MAASAAASERKSKGRAASTSARGARGTERETSAVMEAEEGGDDAEGESDGVDDSQKASSPTGTAVGSPLPGASAAAAAAPVRDLAKEQEDQRRRFEDMGTWAFPEKLTEPHIPSASERCGSRSFLSARARTARRLMLAAIRLHVCALCRSISF